VAPIPLGVAPIPCPRGSYPVLAWLLSRADLENCAAWPLSRGVCLETRALFLLVTEVFQLRRRRDAGHVHKVGFGVDVPFRNDTHGLDLVERFL
jgi:hypothetical protein